MKKLIKIQVNPNRYDVHFGEDNKIGIAIRDVDGYFYFIFEREHGGGTWGSWSLRLIADLLEELNHDWDEQIKQDFESHQSEIVAEDGF